MDNTVLPFEGMDNSDMNQESRSPSLVLCHQDSWQDVLHLELDEDQESRSSSSELCCQDSWQDLLQLELDKNQESKSSSPVLCHQDSWQDELQLELDENQKSRSCSPVLCLQDSWQDVLQLELDRNPESRSPSPELLELDRNPESRSPSPELCRKDSWQDVLLVELDGRFTNLQPLAVGRTSKIYRAMQKDTQKMLVLKCLYRKNTNKKSFLKEFNYNYFLSTHPNILKSFNISINTTHFYVFGQEHAIGGDLSKMIAKGGLGESQTKNVTEQITYALDFLHRTGLVHRDICLENIFVFDNCLTNIKLGDFGQTETAGTIVIKENLRASWSPPEICLLKQDEEYYTDDSSDAWQMGILIFVCLTGSFPWSSADCTDKYYMKWLNWISNVSTKIPPRFKCFSSKLMDVFHCLLEPNPMLRGGVEKVYEYLHEPWLIKEINCKDMAFYDSSSFIFVTSIKSNSEISQETKVKDFLEFNANEILDYTKTNTSYVTLGSYSQKSI